MKIKKNSKKLTVEIDEVVAGWIYFNIINGTQVVENRFSHIFDPILDLKYWLEAIATGVQQTSFQYDPEGYLIELDFKRTDFEKDLGIFTITQLNIFGLFMNDVDADMEIEIFLEVEVNRKQLVDAFYSTFNHLSVSEKYNPFEWEIIYVKEWLIKVLKMEEKEVVEFLLGLERDKLEAALNLTEHDMNDLFDLHLNTEERVAEFMSLIDKEIKRLKGKRASDEYYIDWDINEKYNLWSDERKRKYIQECLEENIHGYSGTKLKEFQSNQIEEFLKN